MRSNRGEELKISEDGVVHISATGVETILSWDGLKGLQKSWFSAKKIYLAGREGSFPLNAYPQEELKEFVLQFYNRWRARHPNQAKKNAFDFTDYEKGFFQFLLAGCLFFFIPIGVAMVQDSHHQAYCTKLLHKGYKWTEATVLSKKHRGENNNLYFLDLSFQVNGKTITGSDQYFTKGKEVPPNHLAVMYSPQNPSCWDLSRSPTKHEAYWQKRHYFTSYLGTFGVVMTLGGLFGFIWSIFRLRERNPLRDPIREFFQFH